jgi:CO/xanthine dehydrogenase FAD-binding subunit
VLPFRYVRPRTFEELFDLLAQQGSAARLLAGGTDLLVRLRLGHIKPAVVADVKHLSGLSSTIVESDGCIRVGAGAVMSDLIADARVRRHFPALVDAATVVGSVQIRNRATLAGNICNASPAADTAPALLAYGAGVNLVSAGTPRHVPLADFFTGPGRTVMNTGEIAASIDLPVPATRTGAAFGRITRRYGVDLATINLCCVVTAEGETRFAFGAVGPRPFSVVDRTGTLANDAASREARDAILTEMLAQASPISDVRADRDYRTAMLEVMSRRALAMATARLRLKRDT